MKDRHLNKTQNRRRRLSLFISVFCLSFWNFPVTADAQIIFHLVGGTRESTACLCTVAAEFCQRAQATLFLRSTKLLIWWFTSTWTAQNRGCFSLAERVHTFWAFCVFANYGYTSPSTHEPSTVRRFSIPAATTNVSSVICKKAPGDALAKGKINGPVSETEEFHARKPDCLDTLLVSACHGKMDTSLWQRKPYDDKPTGCKQANNLLMVNGSGLSRMNQTTQNDFLQHKHTNFPCDMRNLCCTLNIMQHKQDWNDQRRLHFDWCGSVKLEYQFSTSPLMEIAH